jgi:hypothetical protein
VKGSEVGEGRSNDKSRSLRDDKPKMQKANTEILASPE